MESEDKSSLAPPPGQQQQHHHLCVLIHGLWGQPKHLDSVAAALREKYVDDPTLHILVPSTNAGHFTYDGIELGAERVTKEIEDTVDALAAAGGGAVVVTKISVVGYSLGGLVARYVIGLLYSKGWFERMEPVNFTTFATPHLGVRTPLVGVYSHVFNFIAARTLSASGRQLFATDSFRDTGRPLLSILADPQSVFMRALRRFRRRTLYANITNDRTAAYYTTGIARFDPYVDLAAVEIPYLDGYEQVLVDPDRPVTTATTGGATAADADRAVASAPWWSAARLPLRKGKQVMETTGGATAADADRAVASAPWWSAARLPLRKGKQVMEQLPTMAFFACVVPIGVAGYLVNAGIQSLRSQQRIRLHEQGKSAFAPARYRIPLMVVEEVQTVMDDAFRGAQRRHSQSYLPAPATPAQLPPPPRQQPVPDFPTLALTPAQFAMIHHLDDDEGGGAGGFRKYPVHIHRDRHSHAAIIVRWPKKTFDEGRVVLRHWLEREFDVQ
ncbi:MAG: hypothetical protein M1826_000455 [Phylliscum demangeonii]|nr:MAG: hypothetical protein M1826_000455 [Phylliscum demangeonii]